MAITEMDRGQHIYAPFLSHLLASQDRLSSHTLRNRSVTKCYLVEILNVACVEFHS